MAPSRPLSLSPSRTVHSIRENKRNKRRKRRAAGAHSSSSFTICKEEPKGELLVATPRRCRTLAYIRVLSTPQTVQTYPYSLRSPSVSMQSTIKCIESKRECISSISSVPTQQKMDLYCHRSSMQSFVYIRTSLLYIYYPSRSLEEILQAPRKIKSKRQRRRRNWDDGGDVYTYIYVEDFGVIYADPIVTYFCIPASGRVCVSGRTLFFMSGLSAERHVHTQKVCKRICIRVRLSV